MKLKFTSQQWLMLACLLVGSVAFAQQREPLDIANEHIRTHLSEWGYSQQDMDGMTVNDIYTDKSTGISRVFFLQRHQGIPVYNAIMNVNIAKDGRVFFVGKRFEQGLAGKVNTTVPVLAPEQAVQILAAYLGLPGGELRLKEKISDTQFVFEKGNMAREDISAMLSYQPYQGKVVLAWDILFAPVQNLDKWSTRVDAVNGTVLNEYNWTVYCKVDGKAFSREDAAKHEHFHTESTTATTALTGGQYNVWPAPIESPSHGPRTMVTDPHDLIASPYGWHDTDGVDGAEFTITRGNNVHAYLDRDDLGSSSNDEPDGGADLIFDFPYDPSWEPQQYTEAAVVNLFYWSNYIHDFTYRFGFNEPAGNFQQNNYGNGGQGNDALIARGQAAANVGSANNAFYSHANDGSSGSINMFVWTSSASKFLTVTEPASVAGQYETSLAGDGWALTGGPSGTGAYVSDVPVSGEVVIIDDGVEEPYASDGCETIVNASEVQGKIALIDRGGCEFGFKVLQAQNAGAIGVIICNFEDAYLTLGPGAVGNQANIPVVFINVIDCQTIRQFVGNGLKATLVNPGQTGPTALDGDLDNGIIAHEIGHGVSIRLTGGPGVACLSNPEQMGEGWSDWLALVTSVKPGDTGTKKRGVGTYALAEPTNGTGIRRYPYSTDMNLSPLTYGNVAANQGVHDLGEVWANMIWDMYWAFVDKYGWSADPYDESSGNFKAIRLVFEGMKTQPCSPGFVDGRDAILAADDALFNGENTCLIWEVFARRGVGYSADQGSNDNAGDQVEAFDLLPVCLNKMTIEKSVTDFIQPGDDIEVTITVGNYKPETATNVVVTDEIPAGTTFKAGSSNVPASVQGNIVSFNLGDLGFTEVQTITYTLESSPNLWSQQIFLDDVPEDDIFWLAYPIGDSPSSNIWTVTDAYPANSGDFLWICQEGANPSRQALELDVDEYTFQVSGNRPALRFYHRYQTQAGLNGGVVDIREVGTTTWKQLNNNMLRNGYPGFLAYGTFVVPNLQAFSGNSGGEFEATYIDLSDWVGKDIQIRFRFGTDANTNGGIGWLVDDIEFMDLLSYNSEACVTNDQGDTECAIAPEDGTIVDSKEGPLDATEQIKDLSAAIYPNPASDMITVELNSDLQQEVNISFLSVDGRQIFSNQYDIFGKNYVNLNTSGVPAGFYFVKINTAEGQFVEKVIIE
jgi:uncharacterized repeat protein (TIGR01451 family)